MNDRDELVAHLRKTPGWPTLGNKAADQIERDGREIERLRAALKECQEEIDQYIWQEYPADHPVHERYRQRDFSSNPARAALNPEDAQ